MPSVGSITYNFTPVTKTAAYTALNGQLVLADATSAAFTVTLPASPVAGMQAAVKKTDSTTNAVTVISGTAATIDGDSSAILLTKNSSGTFVFDGTNWKVVATSVFNTTVSVPGGGPFPSWAAGSGTKRVYSQPFVAGQLASAVPGQNISTGWQWFPMQIPNACTISSVGLWNASTSTTNGGTFYVQVYADSPTATSGGPAARLQSTTITMSNVANAISSTTVAWGFAAAQTVWVGIGYTSSSCYLYCPTIGGSVTGMIPGALTAMSGNAPASGGVITGLYTAAYSYSSLPPADASAVTTTAVAMYVPLMLFTVA